MATPVKAKEKKEPRPSVFDNVKKIMREAFDETLNEFPVPRVSRPISKALKIKKALKKAVDVKKKLEEVSIKTKPTVKYTLSANKRNYVFTLQSCTEMQTGYDYNSGRSVRTAYPATLGNFYMEEMRGCKGVAVLYYLSTNAGFYRQGYGTFMHLLAEKVAKRLGFIYIQGTVISQMSAERSLLTKLKGWKVAHKFRNKNSGNTVYCYQKKLR